MRVAKIVSVGASSSTGWEDVERKIIIERLPDWSYGAFLNMTDSSCIAIGQTAEDARLNAEIALQRNEQILAKIMSYIASFNIQNPQYDQIKAILVERLFGISR